MVETHASVRVKGSENCYEPVLCNDPKCSECPVPHMHCPLCPSNEFYLDMMILRAHFRVKHVDKGIDAYGLKIIRCCDRCDIVGSIKGTKEIRGAHWHCYRCRNAFNRRDEAIKHYRTHFRSPQTTYQIQIVSDINQALIGRKRSSPKTDSVPTSSTTAFENFTEQVAVRAENDANELDTADIQNSSSAADNEIFESDDTKHLAVIAEEESVGVLFGEVSTDVGDDTSYVDDADLSRLTSQSPPSAGSDPESQLVKLQRLFDNYVAEKKKMENRLRTEIRSLQRRVALQATELEQLRRGSAAAAAIDSPPPSSTDHELTVDAMLDKLRSEYDCLLLKHVADVRRQCVRLFSSETSLKSDNEDAGTLLDNSEMDAVEQDFRIDNVEQGFSGGGSDEDTAKFQVNENEVVVSSNYSIVAVPTLQNAVGNTAADGLRKPVIYVKTVSRKRPNDVELSTEMNGNERKVILLSRPKFSFSE